MIETTHTCGACDGDGEGEGLFYHMNCPACLGAGTISDRMPVADALADAETLRVYLTCEIGEIHPDTGAHTAGGFVFEAGWAGGCSVSESLPIEFVPGWARLAAHEAYRAVPGLRGE